MLCIPRQDKLIGGLIDAWSELVRAGIPWFISQPLPMLCRIGLTRGANAMRKYHLSCGNSTRGSIGLCGSVRARSRNEALLMLQGALALSIGQYSEIAIPAYGKAIDYVNVYISPENITLADIELEH